MMNYIWGTMLLAGIIVSLVRGDPAAVMNSMLKGAGDAVTVCITLAAAYMLWLGLMGVARRAGVIDSLAKRIRPAAEKLFPGAGDAVAPITLNLSANFFGMGNAATPFGLSAMKEMEKKNPHPGTATDAMCMFLAVNCSAIQLIPTSIISLRAAQGSSDPYCIVLPTLIASTVSTIVAVAACKLMARKKT
jgi:spore maturation protein A